ncbi:MAG: hypothetical protein R2729_01865 [Bryobacteraceae bacterium]
MGITEVRAVLLPDQKLAAIEERRQRRGAAATAGDGINDAQALGRGIPADQRIWRWEPPISFLLPVTCANCRFCSITPAALSV